MVVRDRLEELTKNADVQEPKNNTAGERCETTHKNATSNIVKQQTIANVISQHIEKIEDNINQISSRLRELGKIDLNQKDLEKQLNNLFENNTTIALQVQNKLKELEQPSDNAERSAENRIKNILFSTLTKRFQNAFQQNMEALETYRDIQKNIIKKQLWVKGNVQATDEEITALIEEGQDVQIFTDNIIRETADAKRLLADVEDRKEELLKIERMLTEVRDMFVQMSILVESQQELIDRIEYQVVVADEYVTSGAVDLGRAGQHKTKSLRLKIYIFIALAVVTAIVLVAIFKP